MPQVLCDLRIVPEMLRRHEKQELVKQVTEKGIILSQKSRASCPSPQDRVPSGAQPAASASGPELSGELQPHDLYCLSRSP